jgi:hypothetical protein
MLSLSGEFKNIGGQNISIKSGKYRENSNEDEEDN